MTGHSNIQIDIPSGFFPPPSFRSRRNLLRRAYLWFVVCFVCAVPSLFCALDEFDRQAMLLGISIFALGMFAVTSTDGFYRFSRKSFVRRTLYIGYGIRIAVSVIFPIGMIVDLVPGIISISLVSSGSNDGEFVPTLVITIVQGVILNGLLSVLMLLIWVVQMIWLPKPDRVMKGCQRCGYELIATAPDSPCPECGSSQDADHNSTLLERAAWWQLLTVGLGLVAIMCITFLITGSSL